jgi:DNA-binding response OmpR family regulator
MKMLLVEDDADLAGVLAFSLGRAGFDVLVAEDTPTALHILEEHQPDVAVLDVMIGPWNGFDLLKMIRARSAIPVLMLTGLNAEDDKIRGLQLGADDYIVKPFSHRELLARIQAQLRRHARQDATDGSEPRVASYDWGTRNVSRSADRAGPAGPASPRQLERTDSTPALLQVGPLSLNTRAHAATLYDKPLALTVTEFRLMRLLMQRAGTVVPVRDVIRDVWGAGVTDGPNLLRVVVFRLRRKLERDPSRPSLLRTIPGVGLLLKPDDSCETGEAESQ